MKQQTSKNQHTRSANQPVAVVGIIMGSDSDYPTMQAAEDICRDFGIAYEVRVVSAHRTPSDMAEYGRTAHERGLRVIIAGAGGAAHLPGMVASFTTLPVIGVPVQSTPLLGLDALLSIVQMPAGVPVATMAVGGAKNAGLLAAQILACGESPAEARKPASLTAQLLAYKDNTAQQSRAKNAKLDQHRKQHSKERSQERSKKS
jgi:5-(carboxyamino)imidazole ribonucleotide mutase